MEEQQLPKCIPQLKLLLIIQATVHVLDASRSVPVVSNLINPDKKIKDKFINEVKDEYEKVRENHKKKKSIKNYLTIEDARKNKLNIDWAKTKIKKPEKLGITVLSDYPLSKLKKYIDWTPFFLTWEIKGKYPAIFENKKYGETAKKLFDEANILLDKIIAEKLLTANGVFGLYPANSVGYDDIEIYTDDTRKGVKRILHTIRSRRRKLIIFQILPWQILLLRKKAD